MARPRPKGPIKYQPPLKASDINLNITYFNANIEQRPTLVQDQQCAILIKAPQFSATATIEIPSLPPGANIEIGWIQACTDMDVVCQYGDIGITSWEVPELVSGIHEMVSDSDGKQYPWYGTRFEFVCVKGPMTTKFTRPLLLLDNLVTSISLDLPKQNITNEPSLTFVYRKQKFFDFLVFRDLNSNSYEILKSVGWTMEFAIDVDPKAPLGSKSRLLGPINHESPKVFPDNQHPKIKCNVFGPPTCNDSQVLMWRPFDGEPEILQPPKITTVNLCKYAVHSDVHTKRLMLITKENYMSHQI